MSNSKGKGKNAGKKTMGKSMKRGETNDIDEEQEDYSDAESIVEAEEEVLDALGNDDSMSGSEDEEDSEPHDVEVSLNLSILTSRANTMKEMIMSLSLRSQVSQIMKRCYMKFSVRCRMNSKRVHISIRNKLQQRIMQTSI
jgi:uncharacterized membrane protein YhiD involved in acid resistance